MLSSLACKVGYNEYINSSFLNVQIYTEPTNNNTELSWPNDNANINDTDAKA